MSSTDGMTWTFDPHDLRPDFMVERGQEAVAAYTNSNLYSYYRPSPDSAWQQRTDQDLPESVDLCAGEQFIAVGGQSIAWSDDGMNWFEAELPSLD